jgi:hypothetical protein
MNSFLSQSGLDTLRQHLPETAADAGHRRSSPADWNPPFCGDIDMEIRRDGRWFYQGSVIARPALVRLFASVLRQEGEAYYLVTPVEKVGIRVEDQPFVAGHLEVCGPTDQPILRLCTTLDDWIEVSDANPLRFDRLDQDGLAPAVLVRDHLWARLSRPVSFELAGLGQIKRLDDTDWFGVFSHGAFFPMIEADALDHA